MVHAIGVHSSRPLPPSHREAIREIFLRRRAEYTTHDAASLLRLSYYDFSCLVESGEVEVHLKKKRQQLGGRRHRLVMWNELAAAALVRWSVVQVSDALGKHANRVLPPLLRPAELKGIRLPSYQVRLLERLATRDGITVEEYVYNALLQVETAADPHVIETLVPGFHEAMSFPDA